MDIGLRARVLPENQRRSLDELTSDLDLNDGDVLAKRSAFWTMLFLASCIACAGMPSTTVLLDNSQISSRTSPGLVDLLSALATGFAGAIALARRDVAAILPGFAIAISLVPPLGVVGICLGQGAVGLAFGALVLFLSNFLALVFAGTLVFTSLGYMVEADERAGGRRRSMMATFGVLVLLALVPMVVNSVLSFAYAQLDSRVTAASQRWISGTSGAELTGVDNQGFTATIHVTVPGELPPVASLMKELSAGLPGTIAIVIERSVGDRIEAGTTT